MEAPELSTRHTLQILQPTSFDALAKPFDRLKMRRGGGDMMKDWRDEIIDALHDLDNEIFNEQPCSIIFFCDIGDDGERYIDAEMVKGLIVYGNREKHNDLGDIIGADDLMDAIKQLAKRVTE